MKKLCFLAVLILFVAGMSAHVFGQAEIYTTNIQGDPYAPNSTFTVDVAVTNNSSAILSYFFEVHYDVSNCALTGIADGQLGGAAPALGPVAGSGADTYRNASTLGNFSSTLAEGTLCRLTFQTTASPAASYSITLSDSTGNEGLVSTAFSGIAHVYNLTATDPIPGAVTPTPPPPTPTDTPTSPTPTPTETPTPTPTPNIATVYTTNIQGNPYAPNSTFTVDVALMNNIYPQPVQSYFFQVHFDANSVDLTGIADVDLGGQAPEISTNIYGSGADSYRNISTLGNFSSTLQNGTLCTLTFTTTNSPASPYSVWITDDPINEELVAKDFTTIPRIYNNSETNPFPVPITPIPTVTPSGPTPTPTETPIITPTPTPSDLDADGLANNCESDDNVVLLATNATITNMYLADSDLDGLLDGQEDPGTCGSSIPTVAMTNPRNPDTDGDRILDGIEVKMGTDPLDANDPASYIDADGDRLPSTVDPDDNNPDTDGDKFGDAFEYLYGDANDSGVIPNIGDADGDGDIDAADAEIALNIFLKNYTPYMYPNLTNADVNGDGVIDNVDAFGMNWFSSTYINELPIK